MRRAQLLSLDALMAMAMVIMLVTMVSATSENLREGITGLVNWYDRANLPDTMLDVLLKNPGTPANWTENLSLLVVPGLESETGQYVDYEKMIKFIELAKEGDSRVIGFLKNLSLGRNFQLEIYPHEETVSASLNYLFHSINWTALCGVKDIVSKYGNPANESLYLTCPGGSVSFTPSGVSFDTFTDYKHICVNGSMYIGNNFRVISGEYVGVSGNLTIKSEGTLNSSEVYVIGDATFDSNAHVYSSGDLTVGGKLDIKSDGHVAVGGSAYLYNVVEIENSGYLSVDRDFYAEGPLLVHSNGHLTVGGNAYVNNYVSAESTAYINVGDDFYINGDLKTDYNAYINTGGGLYVKGDATIKGSVTAYGMYVNGSFLLDSGSSAVIYGDLYVNGDLSVSGDLIVYGNLYVNGDISVEPQGSIEVKKDLYLTGSVVKGKYNIKVDGSVHRVTTLPWDESKLSFSVTIPSMKPFPCGSAQGCGLQVVFQNLTITYNYNANWFEPGWNGFSMINGTLVSNSNPEVNLSKEEASWISYSERKIVLRKLVYTMSYVLPKGTRERELYGGILKYPLPTYSTLSVEIPNEDGNVSLISLFSNETMRGYGVLAVVRSGNRVLYLVKKTIFQGSAKVTKVCDSVNVNNNSIITVPWGCLIEPSKGVIFSVWAHEVGFTNVTVTDSGSLEGYMGPVFLIGKVKLWVWDER